MPDATIHRGPVTHPTEVSKLASRREPGSLAHLWRTVGAAQSGWNRANDVAGQLQRQVNKLSAPQMQCSTGMHPFKIYQLPPQYRNNPSNTDWLKFRCRVGIYITQPRVVPTAFIGTPNDGYQVSSNCGEYGGFNIGWANPLPGSGTGVPMPNIYIPSDGPFTLEDEVYLINGGDPEYSFPTDLAPDDLATAYFWVSNDVDGDGNTTTNIHFGGWVLHDDDTASFFGDDAPWLIYYGGGWQQFSLPWTSTLMSQITPIGDININNGKVYITQYVYGHLNNFPDNWFRYAGVYSDSIIYWSGDVVFDATDDFPWGDDPSRGGYYLNIYGNVDQPYGNACSPALGVSGVPPSTDITTNNYWLPMFQYVGP